MLLKTRYILVPFILVCPLSSCSPEHISEGQERQALIINVSDFGAFPDDGLDDRKAINEAISVAAESGGGAILKFSRGVYDLFTQDLSSGPCLIAEGIPSFTVEGAADDEGQPATVFLRSYKIEFGKVGHQILKAVSCPDFTLKNIVFDNSPRYMTAGEVIGNSGNGITIKILEGNPVYDNTPLFCCNLWNKATGDLKKAESLTFGNDVATDKNLVARLIDQEAGIVAVNSSKIAASAEIGDIISWNFGWEGRQVVFEHCDRLNIENVSTESAIGFCMESYDCRDIKAVNVSFRKAGNQYHVGSRDAWKLRACSGNAIIDNMYCEGVRWDGQNVHGGFLWIVKIVDSRHMILSFNSGNAGTGISAGSRIGLMDGRENEQYVTVKGVSYIEDNGILCYLVETEEDIPDFANNGTVLNVYSWSLDSYKLRNSIFRNIAGSASVIRNDNCYIENCSFTNIMYPAICAGGSLTEGEGPIAKNLLIRNCDFHNCGWVRRNGATGAIVVKVNTSQAFQIIPYIRDVTISGNDFYDCPTGIFAQGISGLEIYGNRFFNVDFPIQERDNINTNINF